MENFNYTSHKHTDPSFNVFEPLYLSDEDEDPKQEEERKLLEKKEREERRKQRKLEKKRKKKIEKMIQKETRNHNTNNNDGWQSVSAIKALKKKKKHSRNSENKDDELDIEDGHKKIVLCPSDIVGQIIGKNGSNIKKLRKREKNSTILYDSSLGGFCVISKQKDSLLRLELKLREDIKVEYENFKEQKKQDKKDKLERKKRRKGETSSE